MGNVFVFVSDDGSTDSTLEIIKNSKKKFPNITFKNVSGPRRGFEYNFLSIFDLPEPPAKFIAYADQDDLWERDKLARAINWLSTLPAGVAGLYGGRTRLINEENKEIGYSPLFCKNPCFANALVQNIFGGNTMVMNAKAWQLMKAAQGQKIISHDWWTYQVISGAGGAICYDPDPSVRYRQHENNIIGENNSLKARIIRIKMLLQGRFKIWNETQVAALSSISHLLTPENQQCLADFACARNASFIARWYYFRKAKAYRQTFFGMLGLWVAVFLGKI